MAVATPPHERAAGRRALAARGLALKDGSFPVPDAGYWDKARQAVGRVKDPAKREQVAKLLRKTAPRFGKTQALKESWAAPGGSQHANEGFGVHLAVTAKDDQGLTLTCPECSYSGPANRFGANGAAVGASALLRTPAPGTGSARSGVPLTVKSRASHALANPGGGVELAAGTLAARRHPVQGPMDVLAARGENGTAVLRHRIGGATIASLRKDENGRWVASVNGRDLEPRSIQRTAIMDAVGTWNKALSGAVHSQEPPLQAPPQQTPLMEQFGIPAMRAATFATPATSSAGGPRVTAMGGSGKNDPDRDGDNDYSVKGDTDKDYAGALGPKGRAAFAKLRAKGMPGPRALALAKRVDSMTARAA